MKTAGTTLTTEQVHDAAVRLRDAAKNRTQMGQLSLQYPNMTIDDAYAVQRAWADIRYAEGRKLLGRKIGLTSRTMQEALKINTPDSGLLPVNPCAARMAWPMRSASSKPTSITTNAASTPGICFTARPARHHPRRGPRQTRHTTSH